MKPTVSLLHALRNLRRPQHQRQRSCLQTRQSIWFFVVDANLKNADGNTENTDVVKINITKEKAENNN